MLIYSELTYPSVSWQEARGTANRMIEEFIKRPCTVMWAGLEEPTCKVTPTPWPDGPKEGTISSTRWELSPWNRAPERSCACREANWATPDRGRGGRGCEIQKKTQTIVKIRWATKQPRGSKFKVHLGRAQTILLPQTSQALSVLRPLVCPFSFWYWNHPPWPLSFWFETSSPSVWWSLYYYPWEYLRAFAESQFMPF